MRSYSKMQQEGKALKMFVGSPSAPRARQIYETTSKNSISYAIEKLRESIIAPYVTHLYLYGSCARKQQNEYSDVDLLLQLSDSCPKDQLRECVFLLKSEVMPLELGMNEVDLKVVIGDKWKDDPSLYFENIRRDGIDLWGVPSPLTKRKESYV